MNNFSSLLKQHNIHELDSSPPPPSEDFLDQILSSVPNSTTSSSFPWSADDPGFFNHKPSMLHHQHQMFLRNRPLQSNDHNDQLLDASPFQSHNHLQENDASLKSQLFNGFNDGQNSEHFHHNQGGAMQSQNLGAAVSGSSGGGGAAPRQRVRAKRGQATDPHSIAERLRRERIAERMKNLQELVPNGNKTDKASMLDEIIDYVKFLQLQVKVLSVSRLGGASAVAPLMADMASASEGRGSMANISNGTTSMENDVAKLLEEDMGSAMQYLQGKGLCLMPISLASAISTVTRNPNNINTTANNQGPTSPSMSALTVQSATVGGCGSGEPASRKDGNSVSKP